MRKTKLKINTEFTSSLWHILDTECDNYNNYVSDSVFESGFIQQI